MSVHPPRNNVLTHHTQQELRFVDDGLIIVRKSDAHRQSTSRMRSTVVIAMLLIASTPAAVMCRQASVVTLSDVDTASVDSSREPWLRHPRRAARSRNLVFKPPMAISFPGDEVFDGRQTRRFQQQVISAGGFMSLSEGDAFNHPSSEPEIITAPPAIVQLVVRTAMAGEHADGRPSSVKEVDSDDGVEVTTPAVTMGSVTPTVVGFRSSGKAGDDPVMETSTLEMEPIIVTEAGDRNPFPSMEQFMPTSRFRTPVAIAQNRLGQWSRGSTGGDASLNHALTADGLGQVTTPGGPVASSPGSLQSPSSPSTYLGDGRRRNKIMSWRKRLLPRPGLTPRPKVSSSPRLIVDSRSDQHPNFFENPSKIIHRVTTPPPITQPKRPMISRPLRPRPVGNTQGYPLRPHWPPLGAEEKEVVAMATMDIPRLPTTAEQSTTSLASQSSAASTSSTVTVKTSSEPTSSEGVSNSSTTSDGPTLRPTTGDGMATGSSHEELWATPKVEIRSSSRPYHEIVSPGASIWHQHEQQPNRLLSPPSGTLVPVKNFFPPSSGAISEDFDGFYGETVPSEIFFPNGSRLLTAIGNIVHEHVSTDQVPDSSTTPSSSTAFSPGGATHHPPYVYNGGYTSPRPILFEDDGDETIVSGYERSSARHDIDTSTTASLTSSEIIRSVGTYTYPGYTPKPASGASQAVIAPNLGNNDTSNNGNQDDGGEDYEEEDASKKPAVTKKGGKFRQKDRKRGRIHKDYDADDEITGDEDSSSVKMIEAGIVREVVLDTEKLAYILIGTCCALSVVCLVVVVISMRCRKFCRLRRLASSSNDDLLKHHHQQHAHQHHHHNNGLIGSNQQRQQVHKFVDWEDGVLESHVSLRSGGSVVSSNNEATTHRLGTWFNGRSGLHGNNMALPMGFKSPGDNQLLTNNPKRGAYYVDGKTSSTRDLVSINSENSAGRHRRRRKTGTVGYRVDANSSSPFGSSRGSSDDDVEVETSKNSKRLVPTTTGGGNKASREDDQLADESIRLCPAGAEGEQVEIVNYRKLPSPQFPSAANDPSSTGNAKEEDIYAAATTTDGNSSDWTTSNGAAAGRGGSETSSSGDVLMVHESRSNRRGDEGNKNGNNSDSSKDDTAKGEKEMILWSSNDDRLI